MEYVTIGNVKIEKTAALAPMASVADRARVFHKGAPRAAARDFRHWTARVYVNYIGGVLLRNFKITGGGAGSALMKNPRLFGELIAAAVSATDIPVTVKIRSGWDGGSVNAVELAIIAEKNGAAAVAIHGRTRESVQLRK